MQDVIKGITGRIELLEKQYSEISKELSTLHWEESGINPDPSG